MLLIDEKVSPDLIDEKGIVKGTVEKFVNSISYCTLDSAHHKLTKTSCVRTAERNSLSASSSSDMHITYICTIVLTHIAYANSMVEKIKGTVDF